MRYYKIKQLETRSLLKELGSSRVLGSKSELAGVRADSQRSPSDGQEVFCSGRMLNVEWGFRGEDWQCDLQRARWRGQEQDTQGSGAVLLNLLNAVTL